MEDWGPPTLGKMHCEWQLLVFRDASDAEDRMEDVSNSNVVREAKFKHSATQQVGTYS